MQRQNLGQKLLGPCENSEEGEEIENDSKNIAPDARVVIEIKSNREAANEMKEMILDEIGKAGCLPACLIGWVAVIGAGMIGGGADLAFRDSNNKLAYGLMGGGPFLLALAYLCNKHLKNQKLERKVSEFPDIYNALLEQNLFPNIPEEELDNMSLKKVLEALDLDLEIVRIFREGIKNGQTFFSLFPSPGAPVQAKEMHNIIYDYLGISEEDRNPKPSV